MAIINLTQKNFSKVVSEKIDEMGAEGFLLSTFFGGKEELKKQLADMPDENMLWVNTDHVAAASGLIKTAETGEVVFRIYFKQPQKDDSPIWIKGDDYERFIRTWTGEKRWIYEGEYHVPDGYRAISHDDLKRVTVEKDED